MSDYLSPGAYVKDIEVGTKPIEGVATSNLGMVGPTERGPLEVRLVTSWLEYQRVYGGVVDLDPAAAQQAPAAGSHMPHAVKGYFDNGGQRGFVGRVVSKAGAAVGATTLAPGLVLISVGPGTWANNILVSVTNSDPTNAANTQPDRFRIVLAYYRTLPTTWPANFLDPSSPTAPADPNYRRPDVLEVYDGLSFDPEHPSYVLRALRASNLVYGAWRQGQSPQRPANAGFTQLVNGADGAALSPEDYDGETYGPTQRNGVDVTFSSGLLGLENIDEITLLAAPDEHDFGVNLRNRIIEQCEKLRDRFAILSVNRDTRQVANLVNDRPTAYGGIYWPWVYVAHPNGRDRVLLSPVGHVAGIYARTDVERGVHKAPANAIVRGPLDLEFPVSKGMQDMLNPRGINVIRDFRTDGGIRVWGARTMSDDPTWKYVSVRRLLIFLEESIDEGTQWVVFQPNTEPLWDRVRRSIESFLITVWRNGALMGTRPEEAFYVKCDRTTMTQDDIDNGRLICYIGVAPVKPAEFVIFQIHQWALGTATAV